MPEEDIEKLNKKHLPIRKKEIPPLKNRLPQIGNNKYLLSQIDCKNTNWNNKE